MLPARRARRKPKRVPSGMSLSHTETSHISRTWREMIVFSFMKYIVGSKVHTLNREQAIECKFPLSWLSSFIESETKWETIFTLASSLTNCQSYNSQETLIFFQFLKLWHHPYLHYLIIHTPFPLTFYCPTHTMVRFWPLLYFDLENPLFINLG